MTGFRSRVPGDRGGRVQGVRIRWILYRGPGKVQFDPDSSPAVYGKPITSETKVSFSAPGNYRIRAIAIDGALFSTYDVDVKVIGPSRARTDARSIGVHFVGGGGILNSVGGGETASCRHSAGHAADNPCSHGGT